jgi:hypothetical protein
MNSSRLFNEVGDLYEASIINEGKSRFPGGTFPAPADKVLKPTVKSSKKFFDDRGPNQPGAKTLFPVRHETDPVATPDADGKLSVYDGDKFTTARNSEYHQAPKKKGKNVEKIKEGKINNFMTKSIFDKLYETVMNEEAIPGDDNIEAHDAEALDLPMGDEEGDVTFTLDRETAKKLHEVLAAVLEGGSAEAEKAEVEDNVDSAEGEDYESMSAEAIDIVELPSSVSDQLRSVKSGGNKVASSWTSKHVDGTEGDGTIKDQCDHVGTSHGHALVNAKSGKPTPVTGKSNVVAGRSTKNVGKVAFEK